MQINQAEISRTDCAQSIQLPHRARPFPRFEQVSARSEMAIHKLGKMLAKLF